MKTLIAFVSLVCSFGVSAAGLDCKSTSLSNVEKTICRDFDLTKQDDHLSSLYREAAGVSTRSERNDLKKGQRQWLEDVRDACVSQDCLRSAYQIRIGSLANLYQERWQARIPNIVISELSRRSLIPENELRDLLSDCSGTQLNMNMCSFRSFVEADLAMNAVLQQKKKVLPSSCHATLEAAQTKWSESRDKECEKEADDEAEGGSMRPMIFTGCQSIATKVRTDQLKSVTNCSSIGWE